MIFDNSGRLIWFKPLPAGTAVTDFRVQRYLGKPVLTWWQNALVPGGHRLGLDVVYDSSYRQIAVIHAGNGYQADLHELQLTPQGTALIAVSNAVRCNLSAIGGPADGAVWDGILQEIDLATGLVEYEWNALDHVAFGESYASVAPTTGSAPFDYFHLNSINADADGSLLLSARHTWAIYDISRQTGQIVWRLGGRRSSFKMGPATDTAWQHDAREQADGTISAFDNGAAPAIHRQSRGVVIRLDPARRTASLVGLFEHPKHLVANSQGNFQSLPNGDWLIGFGALPYFSEFDSHGQLVFDAHIAPAFQSYRAFRFPWSAAPVAAPAVAAARDRGGLSVYASWNGATNVGGWRVLAGTASNALAPAGIAPPSGFETAIRVSGRSRYVAVQALDSNGSVLATSPTRAVAG
jgi:hypothetical protein